MSDIAAARTHRVAVLSRPGHLVVEERPVPVPAAGEVLVEVLAVGVCGSDAHCYLDGHVGSLAMDGPIVLGHEAAGIVVAVGAGVAGDRVGEHVSLEPQRPCLACSVCLGGAYNLCPHMRFFAAPPTDGAFGGYVTLPAAFAHPVAAGVTVEQASLLEPVSCAVHSTRQAEVRAGDRVLVTGAGPIGLLLVQVLRAHGAGEVVVRDRNPHKLAVAERLGAVASPSDEPVPGGAFDVLVEATGDPEVFTDGVRRLGPRGRAVIVGLLPDTVPLPADHVLSNEITVRGSFRYRSTWPLAHRLVATGAVDVDVLLTGRYGLDDSAGALERAPRGSGRIKSVVHPALAGIAPDAPSPYDADWCRRAPSTDRTDDVPAGHITPSRNEGDRP